MQEASASYVERIPPVSEYQNLRRSVGWYCVDDESARKGLAASLFSLCAEVSGSVIGCGRVIGDGGIYYYIQDIIVLPKYQRLGIGTQIMRRVMNFLEATAPPNAFVGLMAAQGVAAWYEGFGFRRRDEDRPGMFRVWGT
jgi:GNAT superfamily N-acetyltransferase